MDERCAQLLSQIMSTGSTIKISELAKILNVSTRTIRYDLDKIDDFLKDNGLPQLTRKPGSGIEYSPSYYQKLKLMKLLESINNYQYVLTPEERKKIILTELFQAKGFTTIDEMASLLSVSRGTVIKDLKAVRNWLSKHGLKYESKPRFGIKITGTEKDVRRAVISLLSESIDVEKALNLIKAPINRRVNIVTDRQLKKLFQDLEISPIEEAIHLAEKQLNITFTDSAYSALVIHLALAIKRIQLGKNIVMPQEELSKLKPTKEFAVASSMAAQLEDNYDINIPTAEIGYMTVHLLGSKVTERDIFSNQDWMRLQIITDEIVKSVGEKLNINLLKDGELFSGLLKHLEPTVYRLKHGLPLKNPILKEIKNNYPRIYKAVKGSVTPLEDYIGTKIPDEEIGFIAIHIGAALERSRVVKSNLYKAVVVCGTGVGTAKLLSSRIEGKFANIKILDTISSRRVKEFCSKRDLDLIISTVPADCKDVPLIMVNPLLTEEDVSKIYQFLSTNPPRKSRAEINETSIESLVQIIEKYCTIENRTGLIDEISKLLNIANTAGSALPRLRDLLTERTIRLDVEAYNWEEAIRLGGELLVNNGFVERRYVDAMIDNVKNLGPYIIIAPGVAMPHARPEDGVKQVCMSLLALKKPVFFDNNEPVRLILTFGATDHHSHINVLSDIMKFLELSYKDKVLQASKVQEVVELLNLLTEQAGSNRCEQMK